MPLLVSPSAMFLNFFLPMKTWKNPPSKVAHNRPKFYFFSNANRPKSSPNLNSCSIKISTAGVLYNDFDCALISIFTCQFLSWQISWGHQLSYHPENLLCTPNIWNILYGVKWVVGCFILYILASEYLLFVYQAIWVLKSKIFCKKSAVVNQN